VGNIAIGAVNDPEGETLVLSEVRHLDADGLTAARAEALKLDERAYLVSDVYGTTDPAEPGGKRPPPPVAIPPTPPITQVPPPALSGTGVTSPAQVTKHKKKKRKRCVSRRKRGSKKKGHGPKRVRCVRKKRARPKR
jgi:hypothetical protein